MDVAARKRYADSALLRTLSSMHPRCGSLARSAAILEPLVKKSSDTGVDPQTLGCTRANPCAYGPEAPTLKRYFGALLNASPSARRRRGPTSVRCHLTQKRDAEAIDALSRARSPSARHSQAPTTHWVWPTFAVAIVRATRAVAEWQEALPGFGRISEDARANLGRVGVR